MIRDDGSLVLVDFGLAWFAGSVDPGMTTRSVWSLDYAPPEVREDASSSRGPNHDVYSVGVVLYQILAGRRPPPVSAASLASIDPTLAAIDPVVDRALAPQNGRFATAAEFASALRRASTGVSQPWLHRSAAAAGIRTALLRDVLVSVALHAHDEDLDLASLGLCGAYEALRIHWQREFRVARGSDAPANEDLLPVIISSTAGRVFRAQPWLWQEPSLAEDKHGPAALLALGFRVGDQSLLQSLIDSVDPIRRKVSEGELGTLDASALLRVHEALVDRVLQLEDDERDVMGRLGELPAVWNARRRGVAESE